MNNRDFGCRRLLALLLLAAIAFLTSQTLAQQHVHVDGEQITNCATCHHAQNSALPPANSSAGMTIELPLYEAPVDISPTVTLRVDFDHLSRAPPASS